MPKSAAVGSSAVIRSYHSIKGRLQHFLWQINPFPVHKQNGKALLNSPHLLDSMGILNNKWGV